MGAPTASPTPASCDANGSLLADGTRTFAYDPLGRLSSASAAALSATDGLDGDGNRISATVNGLSTTFDLDLRGLPSVLAEGGRTYLPGMPSLGRAESGTWSSSLTGRQGSVLQSVPDSGAGGARYPAAEEHRYGS